ncbi:fumarylacetoacetate hydrolase family protein [Microbacterium sp. H1-D42]|uniref:fumarylacetoacetate hydrolase family protein n=1 Tax=Microbacterium sp. H1-D42 TaxID=2925844 RepID=UPI001F53BE57|nr:fumarylacetoacetate hydrolase family protein [Microbacterium sp. H1-D42]UNK70471.1 fumarylacetoacetate hydrolase family protein [Microbacterium sp. H1-D42]
MYLTRYLDPVTGEARIGLETEDSSLHTLSVTDLPDLLAQSRAEIAAIIAAPGAVVEGPVRWLPPVTGRTEVWAAGVTYLRSREARIEESQVKDVYSKVYDAERPELFFKSPAWRVMTDDEPIGIRADSELNVPEPEVAVVANADGEAIGYTICNDVSSRSIEGENPLYLPQAKVYAGACALHRRIRLASTIDDPQDLAVSASITRDGKIVWQADTSTARMHRTFTDLLGWAFRGDHHPEGMVLSTGTGIVPDIDITLATGDEVVIAVDGIGELRNTVVAGKDAFTPTVLAREVVRR